MLSRRNVRIKVMQSLYNWFQDKELSKAGVMRNYKKHVATSYELLVFNTHNIIQISKQSNSLAAILIPAYSDRPRSLLLPLKGNKHNTS